jgi:hypothetical protein
MSYDNNPLPTGGKLFKQVPTTVHYNSYAYGPVADRPTYLPPPKTYPHFNNDLIFELRDVRLHPNYAAYQAAVSEVSSRQIDNRYHHSESQALIKALEERAARRPLFKIDPKLKFPLRKVPYKPWTDLQAEKYAKQGITYTYHEPYYTEDGKYVPGIQQFTTQPGFEPYPGPPATE